MHAESKTFPRQLFTTLTLAIIILLGGGIWFYHAEQSAERRQVEKQLAAIAHLKVEQLATWRSERLADAAVLAESPFLAKVVTRFLNGTNDDNTSELRSFFHSLQRHYRYEDILLVDPLGQVHLSLKEKIHGGGYVAALEEAIGDRKPVFVDLHSEGHDAAPHISVVAPIFAGSGQMQPLLGAIVLINDATQFLYPMIQSWPTPSRDRGNALGPPRRRCRPVFKRAPSPAGYGAQAAYSADKDGCPRRYGGARSRRCG